MAILLDSHHLVSDTSLDELHTFAKSLGMKREWFQNHRFPHYDVLSPTKRRRAIHLGAQAATSREIVRRSIRSASPASPPTEPPRPSQP